MSDQSLPTLTSDRLVLEPRGLGDLDGCLAMDAQPEVRQFFHPDKVDDFNKESDRRDLRERILRIYGAGLGYWTIRERSALEEFRGWIALIHLAYEGPEIEIGWRLPVQSWGKGLATESAKLVLMHGFHTVDLNEIIAVIHPDNARSFAVGRRLGMENAGRRRAYGLDLPCLRLRREDFEMQRNEHV